MFTQAHCSCVTMKPVLIADNAQGSVGISIESLMFTYHLLHDHSVFLNQVMKRLYCHIVHVPQARHDFSWSTCHLLVIELLRVSHNPAEQHQCEGREKGTTIEIGSVHIRDICVYFSQGIGTVGVETDRCSRHLDPLRSHLHPSCLQIVETKQYAWNRLPCGLFHTDYLQRHV